LDITDDFNEQNIMIDVDEEILCAWIEEQLAQGIPITNYDKIPL
jgi:hypothetical protein